MTLKTFNTFHKTGGKKNKLNFNKYNKKVLVRPKFAVAGGVKSGWEEVEEMNIQNPSESKINYTIETLDSVGKIYEFNSLFETRINAKNPLLVKRTREDLHIQPGVFKDPYLLNLIFGKEEDEDKAVFYMDSTAFSTLCSAHKSNFPFNLNFTKQGNKYAVDVDYDNEAAS